MSNFKSLMKMPYSKLASKCLALEEILQRYYEFETAHYDLQSKYQIQITKYERTCKKYELNYDIQTTASHSNKKDKSHTEIGERIEIYALEDIETTQFIKSLLKFENDLIKQIHLQKMIIMKVSFLHLRMKSVDLTNYQLKFKQQKGFTAKIGISNSKTKEIDERQLRQQLNKQKLLKQQKLFSPQKESNELTNL
ncbi:unnamed protein product [Paramecium sonneborni]|uniref:Uncharacterized protein n=1 Tax=Paramecium sonneborni TaxID=65129 RepID=A0A8S1NEM9_9CILI|nr:unnamed protein product [Paramecium sonneborni]